jgi:hypothetical protein
MITIGVKSTIRKTIAALSAFDEKQFPFAVSKALNDTAYEARKAIQAAMPSEFTIRRDFVIEGVVVESATKQNLVATVFDRDDFMARQEYGGEKVSINGTSMIAVPLSGAFDRNAIIPNDMRPKNLANTLTPKGGKRGVDTTARITVHNGDQFLVRINPLAGKTNRLQFLYRLMPSATVKPRFNMAEITYKVVRARFGPNLAASTALAMATRREGGTLKDQ